MNLKVSVGVCYGRGGSFFLHSLLDGHPEVICLPPYMMNLAIQIIDHLSLDNKSFIHQFCSDFENLFVSNYENCKTNKYINLENNMTRTQTGLLNLDKELFFKEALLQIKNSEHCFKSRFIGLHLAIYKTLGINTANKKVIFYQLHTPNYNVMRLMRDSIGELLVCHSVRDPIASFIRMTMAHCIDSQKQQAYSASSCSAQVESCFRHFLYAGCDMIDTKNSLSVAVKLETLHAQPKLTMTAICHFLSIQWNDILLQETINHGQGWNGIIGDTTGFNLDKTIQNNEKYRSYLSKIDLIRLEKIAAQRLLKWGYPLRYKEYRDQLDFEAPYTFEMFPHIDVSSIKNEQITCDHNRILKVRSELHSAILKTINYMPEVMAAYSSPLETE